MHLIIIYIFAKLSESGPTIFSTSASKTNPVVNIFFHIFTQQMTPIMIHKIINDQLLCFFQQFFSNLPQQEEKHKILNESGNFLIETVEEPVAAEIKQTLLMVNRRFKELVEQYQTYKQVEVVGKARKEYGVGLNKLSNWLKDAEESLVREVPCRHTELRDYLNELDVSYSPECFYLNPYAAIHDFKQHTFIAKILSLSS